MYTATGLWFETQQTELLPRGRAILDQVAVELRQLLATGAIDEIALVGHTSGEHGEDACRLGGAMAVRKFRKALAERRAQAALDYLVAKGFDPAVFRPVRGRGADLPIATNATHLGRHFNRRIDVHVSKRLSLGCGCACSTVGAADIELGPSTAVVLADLRLLGSKDGAACLSSELGWCCATEVRSKTKWMQPTASERGFQVPLSKGAYGCAPFGHDVMHFPPHSAAEWLAFDPDAPPFDRGTAHPPTFSVYSLAGELAVTAQENCTVFVNGSPVGGSEKWAVALHRPRVQLRAGLNCLAVRAQDDHQRPVFFRYLFHLQLCTPGLLSSATIGSRSASATAVLGPTTASTWVCADQVLDSDWRLPDFVEDDMWCAPAEDLQRKRTRHIHKSAVWILSRSDCDLLPADGESDLHSQPEAALTASSSGTAATSTHPAPAQQPLPVVNLKGSASDPANQLHIHISSDEHFRE